MLQSTENTSWLLATLSRALNICLIEPGQLIGRRAASEHTMAYEMKICRCADERGSSGENNFSGQETGREMRSAR